MAAFWTLLTAGLLLLSEGASESSGMPDDMTEQMKRNDSRPLNLLVWAEHGSSGVWEFRGEPGDQAHWMFFHERLPRELSGRFESWMTEFDLVTYDNREFDREGRVLAEEVKRHFGPGTRVYYRTLLDEDEEVPWSDLSSNDVE